MPHKKLILKQGIDSQRSQTLAEGTWSTSSLVRFWQGVVQKYGGWMKLIPSALTGICRGMHAWADLAGNVHIAFGTEQRLQLVEGGSIVDITPLRRVVDIVPSFSTTSGSPTVTITDSTNGATPGDWVNIVVPVAIFVVQTGPPVLSSVAGGTLAATTYFAKFTYTAGSGETTPSSEASLAVAANNLLVVTSPAAAAGATGYNVYVGQSPGAETKQNTTAIAIGTNWTEPTTGLVAGAGQPTTNTLDSKLIIRGLYKVQTAVDANNYTITASANAAATVSNGGVVPKFTTTINSSTVTVTLPEHGLAVNAVFNVQVSTSVGGITLLGAFNVVSVVDANNFTITGANLATSTATGSENGGNAHLSYLLPTGLVSNQASAGYGAGNYGSGNYGGSAASANALILPLRQWFLDNFGQNLIAQPTNGTLYQWTPPAGAGTAPDQDVAIAVANAPKSMTASFIAMPQQIAVAVGAETGGVQDPNLIRWSDAANINSWTATITNQAGSFRLPTGSKVVAGLQMPGGNALLWTDVDLWAMNYVQPPFIFGFQKVGVQCGARSSRSVGFNGQIMIWPSFKEFYMFTPGGAVEVVQCPVWDKIFGNIFDQQTDKMFVGIDSHFDEFLWFFPSASGSGEIDSVVKLNLLDRAWDFSNDPAFVRTAWEHYTVIGNPLGTDLSGFVMQHDFGNDADTAPMHSFVESGYIDIAEGTIFIYVERLLPDFVWGGTNQTLNLYVNVVDFPGDKQRVFGPYVITPQTEYVTVNARGRQMSIRIESTASGVFWRLGALRYQGKAVGRI